MVPVIRMCVRVSVVRARRSLRMYAHGGKGTGLIYRAIACANRPSVALCTHTLIGGGQRVPILNIRSCNSLRPPLLPPSNTSPSIKLSFVFILLFVTTTIVRSLFLLLTPHSTSPHNNNFRSF